MIDTREPSTWIIIYPGGDRTQIGIAEIVPALDYERGDYAIASPKDFYDDEEGAQAYARALAKAHGLRLHRDIPLLLDEELPDAPPSAPYDAVAHDAFYAAMEAKSPVANTTANLRFLLTSLYTSGCGGGVNIHSDQGQDLLTTLLDAAEGRPFIPFNFREA